MPFVDAETGQAAQVSPEEQSQYWQQAQSQPAPSPQVQPGQLVGEDGKPVDPFSLSAKDLADLTTQSGDKFDLVSQFAARPDLQTDPRMVDKVADAYHQLREQPWYKGLTVGGSLKNVAHTFAGLGRFGALATGGTINLLNSLGKAAKPGATPEELKDAEEEQSAGRSALATAWSSIEQGMTGLLTGASKAAKAAGRGLGITKGLDEYDDNDKRNALFDALALHEQAGKIAAGQGPIPQAITGGEPTQQVQPEETAKLTDPFSWEAIGGATRLAGAAGRTILPEFDLASRITPALEKGVGTTMQVAGKGGALAAKGVEKFGPAAALAAGIAAGHHAAGALAQEALGTVAEHAGLVPEIGGGFAGRLVSKPITTAAKAAQAGFNDFADWGAQVAGKAPMKSDYAQAIKDIVQASPTAAAEFAKGAAFDVGQAAGADTPQERQAAVGLGTAFGLLGGARQVGRHVISGQIVAPRGFDVNNPIPSDGSLPALEDMHNSAFGVLTPGQRTRVNATRLLLQRLNPNAQIFVGDNQEQIQNALTQSGVSADRAAELASEDGFTTTLTDKNGNAKKVIVVTEPGSAPHEAFHALEDVLGESTLRDLDSTVKNQYANQWDAFGRYYASLLNRSDTGPDWRSVVLDKSGWGQAEALEKLYRQTALQYSQEAQRTGGEMPTEQQIKDNITQQGPVDWRTVLTPEEQQAVSDRYIAREKLAENFDAWFKHSGPTLEPGKQMPEKIARTLGQVMQFFGQEPLAGRTSEGLGLPLSADTIERIRQALPTGEQPAQAGAQPPILPTGGRPAPVPQTPQPPAETAQINASVPDERAPGATMTQREVSGLLAEAQGQQSGVKVDYRSAPNEPAGAPVQSRKVRRAIIEAYRSLPDSVRALYPKLFFPHRIFSLANGEKQWGGWVPEVFAANAVRLAAFLGQKGRSDLAPYEIKNGELTPAAWQELLNDTQSFTRNQQAGRTGSGLPLVVPREATAAGAYAPPLREGAGALDQRKADFISMLFGTGQLPKTPRISTGEARVPGNILGQEVSQATLPGRVQPPVVPRGSFEGRAARALGIEGREVQEVNPLRNEIAALGNVPEMLESYQRLNLRNIAHAEHAGEQTKFGGNTLTLQAGFMPRRGEEDRPASVVPAPEVEKSFQALPARDRLRNPEAARMSDDYAESIGLPKPVLPNNQPVPMDYLMRLADYLEDTPHAPNDPKVIAGYRQMLQEMKDQGQRIIDSGIDVEPWPNKGEPYKSSRDMVADVINNKHLYFLPTATEFGAAGGLEAASPEIQNNLLTAPSGIVRHGYELNVNEVLRFVHDFFGHTPEGNEFGPRGEYNALLTHYQLFSPEARRALMSELLMQSSWYFAGRHMRRADGSLPVKGDPDFVPFEKRQFADPKNLLPSEELFKELEDRVNSMKQRNAGLAGEPTMQFAPSKNPRAVKMAAVMDEDSGKMYEGLIHAQATMEYLREKHPDMSEDDLMLGAMNRPEGLVDGFVTNEGEFLDRSEAYERALELQQIKQGEARLDSDEADQLEAYNFGKKQGTINPQRLIETGGKQFRPKTFIVRHGSTEMNNADPDKDLIRGHINVPLDNKGRAEAATAATDVAKQGGVKQIFSSDLDRTMETARAIQKENPGATITSDDRLRPWNFGPTIEGKPTSDMLPKIRDLTANPDKRPPGGETFNEFKDRFLSGFHDAQAAAPDQNSAIVTHYRGTKLLDAWRATGVDNDSIDKAVFEDYDKSKTPGNIDVVDKTGAQFKPKAGEKKEPLIHYSDVEGLKELDPAMHGTGIAGAEATRRRDYPELYVPRTYLGTKGYEKEPGLGDLRYKAEVRSGRLYDFQEDPQGLYPTSSELESQGYAPMDTRAAVTMYENRIHQAGFEGYVNRDANAVAKFTKTPVRSMKATEQFMPKTQAGRDLEERGLKINRTDYGTGMLAYEVTDPSGKVVASMDAHQTGPDDAFVGSVRVNPDEQGKGIASTLYRELATDLQQRGVKNLTGDVINPKINRIRGNLFGEPTSVSDTFEGPTGHMMARVTSAIPQDVQFSPKGLNADVIEKLRQGVDRNEPITVSVPLSALSVGKNAYAVTLQNIRSGRGSKTEGEPLIAYNPNTGKAIVEDGMHRIVQAAEAGETKLPVKIHSQYSDYTAYPPFHQFKPSSQPERIAAAPSADDFKEATSLPAALKQPNWAIVTATKESLGPGNNDVNEAANDNLEKALIADGYNPHEVRGYYKGVDQGRNFLVPGMTPEEAQQYGNKYGQESVLINKGLLYGDGSLTPAKHENTVVGKDAKNLDFYSQLPGGEPFSMGLDFGKRIPAPTNRPEELSLAGIGTRKALSSREAADMTNAELKTHFPEAVVFNKVNGQDPEVSSDIVNSPLYKQAGSEGKAVQEFGDRLASEARKYEGTPEYDSGLKWYSDFVPKLKAMFGKHAQMMAELLAATSPQNAPDSNYAYALDALEGYKSGRYDKLLKKYQEGVDKLADGKLAKWYDKQVDAGKVAKPPKTPSEATYLAQWIHEHGLLPRQSNGQKFGVSSDAVLQVLAREWLEKSAGPKTLNFVKNLLGTGHEATVDVWADRTMRRLGYSDFMDRWRILPKNGKGVNDADFAFSQKAFRYAAEKLGIEPDALQGALWFAEKKLWADNGWGRLDLGDFRKEMQKTEMLKSGIQQRLAKQAAESRAKPMEQAGLFDIQPRNLRQ
jgi:broad specificity phosphatase PhoE/ribosomal protein S18 acetylase RimI-like enzyme